MYATLVDRVTGMLELSLQYAAAKLGETEAMSLLKKNDPDALGYFRYQLAEQVGAFLGETSEHVLEVFIYPETPDEEVTATLPLTLIVYEEKYTAALESVVEALQNAVLAEYRKMLSPNTDSLSVFLNVCFVDEEDFLGRKGLAAAGGSLHAPALKVWSR